jgi:hypothetical protein
VPVFQNAFGMNRQAGAWLDGDVKRLASVLLRHVVPLYADEPNGRPSLQGTGFLVRGQRSDFLVSAAHVLDKFLTFRCFRWLWYCRSKMLRKRRRHDGCPSLGCTESRARVGSVFGDHTGQISGLGFAPRSGFVQHVD